MKPITLSLPAGSSVNGELLQDYEHCPRRLSQDILYVELPTGETIDVGWQPMFDPRGKFIISVFRGDWDNQIELPIEAPTPYAVASEIRKIAFRLAGSEITINSKENRSISRWPPISDSRRHIFQPSRA